MSERAEAASERKTYTLQGNLIRKGRDQPVPCYQNSHWQPEVLNPSCYPTRKAIRKQRWWNVREVRRTLSRVLTLFRQGSK